MNDTVGLTDFPRALREITGGTTATYQRLYRHVIDSNFPAQRSTNGRWLIKRTDLPRIAKALGLNTKEI